METAETGKHKVKYLEAKRKAMKTIYQATGKVKRKRSGNVMQQDNQNLMYTRFQRRWSKLIRILLVASA